MVSSKYVTVAIAAAALASVTTISKDPHDIRLFSCVAVVSALGLIATLRLIPKSKGKFLKADLYGRDINKSAPEDRKPGITPENERVPESLGLVVGCVYLSCVVLFQPFFRDMLGCFNAGVLSLCFMLLLGFADDVLDLRWRHKIALSALATLPLLVSYDGPTDVVLPRFAQQLMGLQHSTVHLGWMYHVAMLLICVFCTNSINIHAGINGLEAGQSFVIACFVALYNAIEVASGHDYAGAHRLSLAIILPFASATLGLLWHNFYPSEVFVGDSFTYLAGMTIAVAGVLGHFSKTLMLFFVPELINFILSLPQLFGFIPCPRHRLPKFIKSTGKLEGVWPGHLNLLNLALHITGPLNEGTAVIVLIAFQVVCCSLGLVARYTFLAHLFKGE